MSFITLNTETKHWMQLQRRGYLGIYEGQKDVLKQKQSWGNWTLWVQLMPTTWAESYPSLTFQLRGRYAEVRGCVLMCFRLPCLWYNHPILLCPFGTGLGIGNTIQSHLTPADDVWVRSSYNLPTTCSAREVLVIRATALVPFATVLVAVWRVDWKLPKFNHDLCCKTVEKVPEGRVAPIYPQNSTIQT